MEKILQLQDLQPGSSYLVRARATNKYGVVSEWSETFKLNVTTDDSPPSTPAAPTVQIAGPQKIVISHDNTKSGGGDLEYDVVSYKVYQNTTNANSGDSYTNYVCHQARKRLGLLCYDKRRCKRN